MIAFKDLAESRAGRYACETRIPVAIRARGSLTRQSRGTEIKEGRRREEGGEGGHGAGRTGK